LAITINDVIKLLPYQAPFLFVDGLTSLSEDGVIGYYTFKKNEYFYKGHFKDDPVTPGVILTEVMAQIGVVALGIYLLRDQEDTNDLAKIALTSNQVDFYLPVYPDEKVEVVSKKIYFRFNKLKCEVKMFNSDHNIVCKGFISGMVKKIQIEK
jgi:3-hydroxyacyl-[acyl-carrier-protein] dehydratase